MRPSAFPFYGIADTKAATNNNSPPVIGETSSESLRIVTVSGNDTATTSDFGILVNAAANDFTVTLPPAASSFTNGNGQLLFIKKTDSSTHTVTIKASGAEAIDIANTLIIANQNDGYLIQSTGTKWVIVAAYLSSAIKTVTNSYSVLVQDHTILANTASAGFTVTLPTAVSMPRKIFIVKKIDTSDNAITINVVGGGSIDFSTSVVHANIGWSLTFQSDGTQWWII